MAQIRAKVLGLRTLDPKSLFGGAVYIMHRLK